MATKSVSVIGFERSGTSIAADVLRHLGYYVEDDLRPPDRFNPAGYGESKDLAAINDELLAALGGSRDLPPLMSPGWENKDTLSSVRDKALRLIRRLEVKEKWAWKDPIMAVTFPFWDRVLPPSHSCIICVRNPLSSGMSHERAFAENRESASRQWFVRNLEILRSTALRRRLLIFFEEYAVRPEQPIREISSFLGDELTAVNVAFVKMEYIHYSDTIDKVLESSAVRLESKLLYILLLSATTNSELLDRITRVTLSQGTLDIDTLSKFQLESELDYYKKIANHPYVRLGRRLRSFVSRLS